MDVVLDHLGDFGDGWFTTIRLSLLSFLLAMTIGLLLAAMRVSPFQPAGDQPAAITKLVAAAGGVVEPYWPKLFGQKTGRQWRETRATVRMRVRRSAQPALPTLA